MDTPALSFFVTFMGVSTAFLLDRFIEWARNRDRRIKLLRDIRSELERNAEVLVGRGLRMNTDVWDSAISSGFLQLLDSQKLRRFSNLYHSIKGNLYEAIICRNAGEEFRSISPSDTDRKVAAKQRWSGLSRQLEKREANLKKRIESVLEEPIWPQ